MQKTMDKENILKKGIGLESYRQIIDLLDVGVYFVDLKRNIIFWNKGAENITGFTSGEVSGRCCSDNILTHLNSAGENLCKGLCPLERCIRDGYQREEEIFLHHKDGHRVPILIRCCPLINDEGKLIGGVEVFTDLSNKKANEFKIMELEKLALLDKLTQIANRNYLERELDSRMDEFRRYGIPFGVLFIDVDHFKSFNDRYGHDVGDRVLQYVAKNMTINARPSDLFGRWGGEEFLGVIRNVTKKEVLNIAERLRILIEKSYIDHLNDHLHVTVSIGGTLVAEKDSVKDLVIRADDQLYKCKKNGRNRVEVD